MHTLAPHPKTDQQAGYGSSAIPKRARPEPGRGMHGMQQLQAAIGNLAVQRLFTDRMASADGDPGPDLAGAHERFGAIDPGAGEQGNAQARLSVNVPGDAYEREADRVADQVMEAPGPACCTQQPAIAATAPRRDGAQLMRQAGPAKGEEDEVDFGKQGAMVKLICPECEDLLQRKESASGGVRISREAESRIDSVKGGGAPLPVSLRAFFEPRLGHDFSNVSIHTDASAGDTATQMNALAYTMGAHIVFAPGQYAPHSHEGKKLLAHELTHVVQQSACARLPQPAHAVPAKPNGHHAANDVPAHTMASPVDIHMKAAPDHIFRHTSAYCDRVFEDCNAGCRLLPNKTKKQKARRALCWSQCMAQYAACLASSEEAVAGILTGAAIAAAIALASADGPFPIGDAAAVGLLGLVGINVF